jgi:hypothetical protein
VIGMEGLKKYPLLDGTEFAKDGLGMVFDYALYKLINAVKPSEQSRTTKKKKVFGALLDNIEIAYRQNFREKYQRVTPKIAAWSRYADGASTVEDLYTVELHGAELPVYIMSEKDTEPTDDTLAENIKTVRDTKTSPYNERDQIIPYYYGRFSDIAAEKYTREDLNNIEDPHEFRKWLVRDDTWKIQQWGKRDPSKEKVIMVDGVPYQTKVYTRPGKLRSWLYWAVGDKIYDAIDAPYDPLQKRVEKGMTPDARQILLKQEYKAITTAIRAFFSIFFTGRTPQLQYDLTD